MNDLEIRTPTWRALRRALVTIVSSMLGLSGCDGSDSSDSSASVEAVSALCARIAKCTDSSPSVEFMGGCRAATASLASVLVDPESFSKCINGLRCEQLADESDIAACVDLDPTTIRCGAKGLLACTNAGLCREIDCHDACAVAGASYLDCGLNQQYGYDTCICAAR